MSATARMLTGSMHGAHELATTAVLASLLMNPGGIFPVSSKHSASTKWLQLRSSRWYVLPWKSSSISPTRFETSPGFISVVPTYTSSLKIAGAGAAFGAVSKIPLEA